MNELESKKLTQDNFERWSKLIDSNEFEKAEIYNKIWIKENPFNNITWYYYGYLKHINKEYSLAHDLYLKSLELNPNHILSYENLSTVLIFLDKINKAKEIIIKGLKVDETSTILKMNLGDVLRFNDEIDKSLTIYKDLINSGIIIDELYNSISLIYYNQGKFDQSIKYVNKALEINKKEKYFINLAKNQLKLEHFQLSRETFEKILSINPSNFDAYNGIYQTYKTENIDHKNGNEFAKKTIQLFPKNIKALINLLDSFLRLKKYEKAEDTVKEILNIDKDNTEVAMLSNFLSSQTGKENLYKFCSSPFRYLKRLHLSDFSKKSNSLIQSFLNISKNYEKIWERTDKTLVNGYRFSGDIFSSDQKDIVDLKETIFNAVNHYIDDIKSIGKSEFSEILNQDFKLRSWSSVLKKDGFHSPHIHAGSVLSGVLYIQIDEAKDDKGAIKFSLDGFNFPKIENNLEEKVLKPVTGDIILFPSCLIHSTIPNKSKIDRITIAFDLIPN